MPLSTPPGAGSGSGYPPAISISEETKYQRELTHWFIRSDPVQIALIPRAEVRQASGGSLWVDGPAREIQVFRLIPMSHTTRPTRSSSATASAEAGVQRKYDFTILGEWDSIMLENDTWKDSDGQRWVIDVIESFNGYERKGMVTSFGRKPSHGN